MLEENTEFEITNHAYEKIFDELISIFSEEEILGVDSFIDNKGELLFVQTPWCIIEVLSNEDNIRISPQFDTNPVALLNIFKEIDNIGMTWGIPDIEIYEGYHFNYKTNELTWDEINERK